MENKDNTPKGAVAARPKACVLYIHCGAARPKACGNQDDQPLSC